MIPIEQPPSDVPMSIRAYLVRMFKVIGLAIDSAWIMTPYDRRIEGKDGMLNYFDGPIPNTPIKERGLYFNVKGTWKKVNLIDP